MQYNLILQTPDRRTNKGDNSGCQELIGWPDTRKREREREREGEGDNLL